MGKKLGLILGAIVALGLLAVTAVLLLLDVNQYRDLIEARLEGPLGRDVTLGEMSLGLFPPRFEVAPASIAEGPAFPGPSPFIETDRLAVRVGLFQLIRGNVRIDSLDLDRPRVELIRSADGTWNFSTLGASAGDAPDAGETTPGGDAAPSFALGRLRISDGQVAVTGADGTRAVYDHIDITLRDFAPGEPFSFDLAAHLPGEGAQELRLEGTGGPFATAAPMETPFGGTLALHEVGMDGLRAFLGTEMLVSSGGALSGETALDSTGGVVAASGSLRLDDARFNGVEVGYPVELDYALEARLAEGLYVFEEATLGLGSAPLSLTGQVDTGADPTRLDLRFRASDVPIEEAARLASAFGIAFPPEAAVAGRLDLDVTATGSADDPAFNGTVAGRQLVVSGTAVRQPVEVDRIDIALSPSRIEAPEFGIRSGQSNATARFALDDYRSEAPRIDARLQAPGATLPDIQSIARAYGVTSLDGIEGAGALDVDLRASGPLDSAADSTAMMRALNGAINLDFSPLTLMGVNTASELGTIGGFDVGSAAGNLTELARLTGQIAIANGIASTDNLQAQLPIGNVAAAGTADLATQQLDLRLSAVLSQAFSQSVGGTGIAGYLRTALSNSAGELVLPVRVRGTFGAPEFSPDTEAIGAMQAERLLPSLQNPGSLLDSLLGGGQAAEPATDPETGEPQEAPPASEPEQVIRGILGGIFGGSDEEN